MIVTLKEAYNLFRAKYPDAKVGPTKFFSLKPKNVRKLGKVDVETCLCLCCQNLRYKIEVLNRCLDPRDLLPQEGKILDTVLCPRQGRWHKIDCIRGNCPKCEDLIAPIRAKCSQVLDVQVRWAHWERIATEKGTKLDVHPKSGSVLDHLLEMEKDLKQPVRGTSFPDHLFTAYWQQDQYQLLLSTLMPGEVLMVEDFAENRKASYAAKVKSAYFAKQQITLHPVVAYYKNLRYQFVQHAFMFISDDTSHDHHLVNHITLKALDFLKDETYIQSAFIYSDKCAGQYKGKGTFADLSLMSGLRVQRIFYGSDHSKGEADGETGVLSQAMARYVQGGNHITSAKNLFTWANSSLTKMDPLHKRSFFFVSVEDVVRDRPKTDVATVPGELSKVTQKSSSSIFYPSPFTLTEDAKCMYLCSNFRNQENAPN